MGLDRYTTAYKRLSRQLDELCVQYKTPKIRFWVDALYCFIYHGASPRDYINFNFFKLNHVERKKFLTMRRTHKVEKLFNDPQYAYVFNNKEIFNQEFSKFVNRKWIYAPEKNDLDITEFIHSVKKSDC